MRKWLDQTDITRRSEGIRQREVGDDAVANLRRRAASSVYHAAGRRKPRLTKERVGRVIGLIGQEADVVVQQPDEERGRRIKYASAHDIRRGCAYRLINAGVSAETLKVVLRHKDFQTTERFYGATKAVQSAAAETREKVAEVKKAALVGGTAEAPLLSAEELQKLKALLASL